MADLKPCPFCGESLVRYEPRREGDSWYQHPTGVCVLSAVGLGDPFAIFESAGDFAKWNRRAAPGVLGTSADERMRHDYPILQQFHSKHALGALSAPSCLCCGQQTGPDRPIAVRHMELPAIVVCKPCKDAAAGVVEVPRG